MLFDNNDKNEFDFRIILREGDLYADRKVLIRTFEYFKALVSFDDTKVDVDLTGDDYPSLATREALRYCLAFAYSDVAFPEVRAIRNGPRPDTELLETTLDTFLASEALYEAIDQHSASIAWHNQGKMDEIPTVWDLIDYDDIARLRWLMEAVSPNPEWLVYAVSNGHTEVVELLLSRLTDEEVRRPVLSKDDRPRTALMWASIAGRKDILELLLARDTDEYAALMYASTNGRTEIVEFLLARVTDECVMRVNNIGCTVLMYASIRRHTEIVELLLARVTDEHVMYVDTCGRTALMCGAVNTSRGNMDIVKLLLARVTDEHVMRVDNNGYTAIVYASNNGYKEIVELLLPRVNDKHQIGDALKDASNNGHTEIVEMLESRMVQKAKRRRVGHMELRPLL